MSAKENRTTPPRWAHALLERYCRRALYEEVSGDLEEQYRVRLERMPSIFARALYWIDVLSFYRTLSLRPHNQTMMPVMWRNYVTVALRQFRRHTGYSFLNVAGLAVGMACFLVVLLFVRDELKYDRYNDHADRIYRVAKEMDLSGDVTQYASSSPMGLPQALEAQFPEIEQTARLMSWSDDGVLSRDGQYLTTAAVYLGDPTVFDVFTLPFVEGTPDDALVRPGTAVITRHLANTSFAGRDPVGEVLSVQIGQFKREYEITGVVEDVPAQSHFQFDVLATMADGRETGSGVSWHYLRGATYVLLKEGADPEALESRFPELVAATGGGGHRLFLQPLTRIHLHSHLEGELEVNGDVRYVYIFSLTAILILLIACVNFTNLATARALRRSKEVGVRKVLGARRGQLVQQLLGEAMLFALMALPAALVLVWLALPGFNNVVDKHLTLAGSADGWVWLATVGTALLVGVLSGSYGAVLLSRFKPDAALKGSLRTGPVHSWLRSGLVVFQFAVSVALVVTTLVIDRQLDYVNASRLGFNQEHVLVVPAGSIDRQQLVSFKQELASDNGVVSASLSSWVPGEDKRPMGHGDGPDGKDVPFIIVDADADFFRTMQMDLSQGRLFGTEELQDLAEGSYRFGYGKKAVVNETLLRRLQIDPADAVGSEVNIPGIGLPQVIGVLGDFHITSFHEQIAPLAFRLSPTPPTANVLLRIRPDRVPETIAHVEQTWKRFGALQPVSYYFLDDFIQQLYTSEQKLARLFSVLAALAIFVAGLGLFGLAAYTAQQRTKEIGIRKVLGATVGNVVVLLSREFVLLVAVAFVVAVPVAYFPMHAWLEGYAYRVSMPAWVFAVAGLSALVIAVLAVSYQAVKAAVADPVDSLRYEG